MIIVIDYFNLIRLLGCKIGNEMIPIMNGENDLKYVNGYPYYCPKRVDKVVRLPIGTVFFCTTIL